ncbi:MAG: hypothetical protein KKF41_02010 [Actinobacteria bacterium]|nr:hypothetical protein [Actinomycetota bacterium]MBU1942348.1 hypothetical protein [Actinomycetota bacterium]MBU2686342.1 hypothetical protein [Actinomycetota bacterium]
MSGRGVSAFLSGRSRSIPALALVTVILLCLLSPTAFSGVRWGSPLVMCDQAASQNVEMVTDGDGGFYAAWADNRAGNMNLYALKVDRDGNRAAGWSLNGNVVCDNAALQSTCSVCYESAAGGLVVSWSDSRSGTEDVYAQKLDSSGNRLWENPTVPGDYNGVPVSAASGSQTSPRIAEDGAGGAIVGWQDSRTAAWDLYAQRVQSSGLVAWTANGIVVCDQPNYQIEMQAVKDGAGGAIFVWQDYRSIDTYDIYAERLDSSGSRPSGWNEDGNRVCLNTDANQTYPNLVSDGVQGASIAFIDERDGFSVYANRILQNGSIDGDWNLDGNLLATTTAQQDYPPGVVADGTGGLIVAWRRNNVGSYDLSAQRIDGDAAFPSGWGAATGVAIADATGDQAWPVVTTDGAGGATIGWTDSRSGNQDIYATRIGADAVFPAGWAKNGIPVYEGPNSQLKPRMTSDEKGGAFVGWQDFTTWYVYAQRISNPAPTADSIVPASGDNSGPVSITDLAGTGFSTIGGTPTVELTRGVDVLTATGVSVNPTGTSITCDFDLTGAEAGPWTVIVTNPDDQDTELMDGFTVDEAVVPPTMQTDQATNVTYNGATLNGNILDTGGENCTRGVLYRQVGAGAWSNRYQLGLFGPGAYGIPISGTLTPGTTYEFKASAFNSAGGDEGATLQFTTTAAPQPAPTVISITPSSGTQGSTVNVTNLAGTDFYGTPAVKLKRTGQTDITATNVVVASPTKITCRFVLPANAAPGAWNLFVQNPDGQSATKNSAFTMNASQATYPTWYLAEGTTAWGFSTYISVVNPNDTSVTVDLTYMPSGEPNEVQTVVMPPDSRATVFPADTLGQKDFSTKVECREGKTIAADRTMEWTGEGSATPECHGSVGVTSPAKTWYLPEGSTNWGFECWLLIQNPNSATAHCTVTYMIEGSGAQEVSHEVEPNSRATFNMQTDIGNKDASIKVTSDVPVIPERAMYRNDRREGHDSIGTTTPALDYYLAEGTSAWGFTTFVLVQNPNPTDTSVNVTYMTGEGPVPHPENPITMSANSRRTIRVNDYLPDRDFSTRVTGDQPIIAERAMYWDSGTGEACHDSIGMDSPHATFYLPDGEAGSEVETWTLVQNPNATDAMVTITYMTEDGTGNVVKTETIGASSRSTFNLAQHSGLSGRAAIVVESNDAAKPVMVERAMYWYSRGAGTDTIGGCSD